VSAIIVRITGIRLYCLDSRITSLSPGVYICISPSRLHQDELKKRKTSTAVEVCFGCLIRRITKNTNEARQTLNGAKGQKELARVTPICDCNHPSFIAAWPDQAGRPVPLLISAQLSSKLALLSSHSF
jgi:hypothetical protein